MSDLCVDCGADAEIYVSGLPVCLKCTQVRDVKTYVTDAYLVQSLQDARKEYRLAIEEIRNAKELRQDLEISNRHGSTAGLKASERFRIAQDALHEAIDQFLKRGKAVSGN
jgi:hypothetical protein